MKNVISFSGGRTSAYLCHLAKQHIDNPCFIFMDTGAEHPKTYEFIRSMVRNWSIPLVCLRVDINPELGQANSYTEISIDQIGPDLKPWESMLSKYGTPYNPGGAFCTDRMKLVPYTKYCNEHFGKGNYITWLGIRADEPRRLNYDKANFKYLADISDFDKQDVLDWWKSQDFNLEIEEHLGNCVFCIKKGANKIALAINDEPALAQRFQNLITSDKVRDVEIRKSASEIMYRNHLSFQSITDAYKNTTREEILSTIRGNKSLDSGNCSESCEVFSPEGQLSFEYN